MLQSYLVGWLTFLILDTLWIRLLVSSFYLEHVPNILSLDSSGHIKANVLPAVVFYLIYYHCLFYLAVYKTSSLKESLVTGAVLGLMAYGTYVFTNHAIMKEWSWLISLSDLAWGIVLSTAIAFAAYRVKLV